MTDPQPDYNHDAEAEDSLTEGHDDLRASSKQFLTAIVSALGEISTDDLMPVSADHTEGPSKLKRLQGTAAEQAKSALLTLHILYPHELLPALDLLDRKLVTKFICERRARSAIEVFYVQSASAVTESRANSRYRRANMATKTHYEVRLDGWNCSCGAFSQRVLKLLMRRSGAAKQVVAKTVAAIGADNALGPVLFGGAATQRNATVPTCKHILAAVIGTLAPNLFGEGIKTRIVSKAELAAWSAGYGEHG